MLPGRTTSELHLSGCGRYSDRIHAVLCGAWSLRAQQRDEALSVSWGGAGRRQQFAFLETFF